MIRKAEKKDSDRIMQIWLDTNISAHSFIPGEYWISNFDEVKRAIEEAEVYVYESKDAICGFIGLADSYIAGIFVEQSYQSQGIGRKLLDYIKSSHTSLSLHVYEKNSRALKFYLREGFRISSKSMDENNCEEFELKWNSD